MTLFADATVNAALKGVFNLVLPELVLLVAACVLFLRATVAGTRFGFRLSVTGTDGTAGEREGVIDDRHFAALIALAALGIAAAVQVMAPPDASKLVATVSPLRYDALSVLVTWAALGFGAVLVLTGMTEVEGRVAMEYQASLLVAVAGLMIAGSANELVTVFLALELISIPTYIMLYLPRQDRQTQEAAVKYFLLSIFSSAVLLFGFSYLYGVTGTTNIPAVLEALTEGRGISGVPALASVAVVMVIAGFGFRITAAPFHFYAPDVYQGAAAGPGAALAVLPKAAGFVALLRVLGYVGPTAEGSGLAFGGQVPTLLFILAAVTMTLGNVLAVLQDNVKRILAYSGIAQGGYMLIGLATAPYVRTAELAGGQTLGGAEAVLFYLVAYGAMTVAVFAALSFLHTPARPVETVDDLAGVGRSHPLTAFCVTVALLSLIGMPLTAGFLGKFLVLMGAWVAPDRGVGADLPFRFLALLGVVNAAVGAYYYLRLILVMYLRTAVNPVRAAAPVGAVAAMAACAFATFALGVYPGAVLRTARQAVSPPAEATPVALVPGDRAVP